MKKAFSVICVIGIFLASCATVPTGNNAALIGQWIGDLPDGSSQMWEITEKDWKLTQSKDNRLLFSQSKPYRVKENDLIISYGMGIKNVYKFELVNPDVIKFSLDLDQMSAIQKSTYKKMGYTDEMMNELARPIELTRFGVEIQISEFTHLEQADDIETALKNAAKRIIAALGKGKNTAISNISTEDPAQSDFLRNELELLLVEAKISLVDRSQLDVIRQEQNFQLSGDVDDNEIVSIGKFAGANSLITGAINGSGVTRRLRLRLLDVETAQIIAAASERF
jgi:hypothetical protein